MFEFRFIFADGCGEQVLEINRVGDKLSWNFRGACGNESIMLNEFGVYDNLRNVFNLLYWNPNMYSHFEFRTAGFPFISVGMNDAYTALPYIEYTMFSLLRNTQPIENTIEEDEEDAEDAEDEEDEVDDEDEEVDEEDEEYEEDADDEDDTTYEANDDIYADMPPLVPVDCLCTPKRSTTTQCPGAPARPLPAGDGPCNNTRSAKRNRDGTLREPSHLFF